MMMVARLSSAAMMGTPSFLKVSRGVRGLRTGAAPAMNVRQRGKACSQCLEPARPKPTASDSFGVNAGGYSCRLGWASSGHDHLIIASVFPRLSLSFTRTRK
jgi:hypothetical protein